MTQISTDPLIANLVDDTGTGQDGTVVDKALLQGIAGLIDAVVHDPANPSASPAAIIGEVVDARDLFASLDDRLDSLEGQVGTANDDEDSPNMIENDDFTIWSQGDTTAPDKWSLIGAGGPSIVRTGPGLGNTVRIGGTYSARLTPGSGAVGLGIAPILNADVEDLGGRDINIAALVRCDVVGTVRAKISDGTTTITTPYNTTTGQKELLVAQGQLSAAPTYVQCEFEGTSPYYAGAMSVRFSKRTPTRWSPAPKQHDCHTLPIDATTIGAVCELSLPIKPAILREVLIYGGTITPGGLTIAIERAVSGAWQPVYSANIIPATAVSPGGAIGGGIPNGVYARRCVSGVYSVLPFTDKFRARVVAADAGAADVYVQFRVITWARFHEHWNTVPA